MTRPPRGTSWLLGTAAAALYLLHQDYWFWDSARPLVFGFLPIGLFYHAAYSLAVAALMWALVRYAWPGHLETEAQTETSAAAPESDGPAAGEPRR